MSEPEDRDANAREPIGGGDGGIAPLIVTLRLDHESSRLLDEQRRQFFPPERNFLAAHITLFHKLPGKEMELLRAGLAETVSARRPFTVAVEGLQFLGAGVAYRLGALELSSLHAELAGRFGPWLTRQDRQPFRPHVTVQNKVTPDAAKALFAKLQVEFRPWTAQAVGIDLWIYRGGPWDFAAHFPFRA